MDKYGYYVIPIKGSGARGKKMRERKNQFAGDYLAIPADSDSGLPWFQCEGGGQKKPIRRSFEELRRCLLPGFRPLVVCFQRRRGAKRASRYYYISETDCVESFEDVLYATRREAA